MNLLNAKEYKIYSNFLNNLAKDLNKFYFSKLNKKFKTSSDSRVVLVLHPAPIVPLAEQTDLQG